jgi:hypothetical protein
LYPFSDELKLLRFIVQVFNAFEDRRSLSANTGDVNSTALEQSIEIADETAKREIGK